MTSSLKGSDNYIWCITSVLGKGATGAVYQGSNKLTGEAVAVKTFNQISYMRSNDVQVREFDALKIVNHENIVRLLAIEEEQTSHNKVIVMELCTGGSLFTILDDPENYYGLDEDEFVVVLNHLAAGMNHLRNHKLIHRDLKPGNIMKYICEDGRSVYKLVDFGAARELEDDQQFMSLYGTEEYLHPDMYERAVLRKPVSKKFHATVDLWSIGVTLYHVATGSLPFRPYGGRRNRDTMHHITTKKLSGVISGVQISENGAIKWSNELPTSCRFSLGLRSLVTPLLAGLMECDQEKMWGFSKFFSEVTDIVNRKIVYVVYFNEMLELRCHLKSDYRIKELQDELVRQTNVSSFNQILIYNDRMISDVDKLDVTELESTSLNNPIVLIDQSKLNVIDSISDSLFVSFPSFPATSSLENEAVLGKISCSVSNEALRIISRIFRLNQAFQRIPKSISLTFQKDLFLLRESTSKVANQSSAVSSRIDLLASLHKSQMELMSVAGQDENCDEDVFINGIDEIVNDKLKKKLTVQHQMRNVQGKVESLEHELRESQLLDNMCKMKVNNINVDLTGCMEKARTYTKKIRDCWQSLARDKASRNLSYHDEQFHILEKTKIQESSQKMNSLFVECCESVLLLARHLMKWFSYTKASMLQLNSLSKELNNLREMVIDYNSSMQKAEVEYKQQTEMIISMMKNKHSMESCKRSNGVDGVKNSTSNTLAQQQSALESRHNLCSCTGFSSKRLQDISNAQIEIKSVLKEHKEMIHEFEMLTLQLLESQSGQR